MNHKDNIFKSHTRILYKWLFCSWRHKKHRCYNEVLVKNSTHWHCDKCHDCGEELDIIIRGKTATWL